MPKLIFMGTPEFAVPSLLSLLKAGYSIPLLVCQPDKKRGRGHKYQFPPTKRIAVDFGIEVYQPTTFRVSEVVETLARVEADFFVVIAYGRILPREVLEIPGKGCVNVHASLLPRWRGAAPIQFSLLNNDSSTGVTTMLMNEGMDTGDILLSREVLIREGELVDSLTERLSLLGAELIVETIERFDTLLSVEQNHDLATYTRLLKKSDRLIHWEWDAEKVFGVYRAMTPVPGVYTFFRGKRLLVKSMEYRGDASRELDNLPGTVLSADENGLVVSCGGGTLSILSCQPECKKPVSARDFINGCQIKPGERLGE